MESIKTVLCENLKRSPEEADALIEDIVRRFFKGESLEQVVTEIFGTDIDYFLAVLGDPIES